MTTPTRRLAAIMAADVAGFSAAMERDEEGTFAQVQELRRKIIEPKIAEHQGRLIKSTGDGFLAEFASPLAATRCALVIQAAMAGAPLQLRIGLNLGDVIVEESGDVYGEGVNVAARLEALADPGGILISAKVHSEVEGKVEAAFADHGEQHVKNIARPVRLYGVRASTSETAGAALTALRDGKPLPLPDKPSIAVLPFQNMSGDPEQEYFADGVVEDIITALSRFKSLFVIARNSSFTYKGKAVDIKQVGLELGVRYVLEGSLRKAGGRVRINGQLIDTTNGAHVWADRFDREMADIFALQDDVTESLVSAVEPSLRSAEIARKNNVPTQNLNAYDLYLRALAEMGVFTKDSLRAAEVFLRRAVELDPNYSDAWALLVHSVGRQIVGRWRGLEAVEELKQAAWTATRVGPENGLAFAVASCYPLFFGGSIDQAVEFAHRAIALHPNSDNVRICVGWTLATNGEFEAALGHFEVALRMAPFGPWVGDVLGGMAFARLFQRHFGEAIDLANRTVAKMPNNPAAWRTKIVALAHAGRADETREALQQYLTILPNASISKLTTNFRHQWMRDLMIDGFRVAGLPE
jgi:adenylate cyclase